MAFETVKKNGLTLLRSTLLEDSAVAHGFSTRPGGVSPAPWDSLNLDDRREGEKENVRENFRRLCAALDTDVQKVVHSRQVHRDDIRPITAADWGKGLWRPRDYESADGLITDVPSTVLTVFSADCNVILLHDPRRRAIGAVHAGWRGTALGLVYRAVVEMQRAYGTDPGDVRAAIGPAIGPCCFESDDDVPLALRRTLGQEAEPYMTWNGRKWHIDLKAVNALWLRKAGVVQTDICGLCTYCHPAWFWSHRRTGLARGEQGALIALREEEA